MSDNDHANSPLVKARRAVAIALILLATTLGMISAFTSHLKVCTPSNEARANSCRALSVTDPVIVGLGVLAAALFASELSEVGLFGLVSWKRQIAETARKQETIATGQQSLARDVAEVRNMIQTQTQSQTQTTIAPSVVELFDYLDTDRLRADIARRRGDLVEH